MVHIRRLELLGAAVAAIASTAVYVWTVYEYRRLASSTHNAAIDRYGNQLHWWDPPFWEQFQCVLLYWTTRWTRNIHDQPYPLVVQPHKYIPRLLRTRAAKASEVATTSSKSKAPLVIGTIRMGFGHHRISYAIASYALQENNQQEQKQDSRDVYFHDIATIGNDESSLVDDAETAYSLGSRSLTELPNPLERLIAKVTSNGGPNALRMQVQVATLMQALMQGLDRASPIIASHPLVGAIAVAAGFDNVINLVVDNHPQWFVVVPGALNLVQGPRLYRELLKLGVPNADLELVGHWNPRNIVESIPQSTQRRMTRVEQGAPLRLLIPVGGAGAQESFLTELLEECLPLVQEGKLELWLNAGDHEHMKKAFQEQLQQADIKYDAVYDVDSRNKFVQKFKDDPDGQPTHPIALFAFNTSYAAVTTTDELVPYADVLVCKPSEMAFYAVPKLLIRRVGDHEAKSAVRAAEVGEGTLEAATVADVMTEIHQFFSKPGDLITMNEMIRKNNELGMYNGAKLAVERALERA